MAETADWVVPVPVDSASEGVHVECQAVKEGAVMQRK